MVDTLDAALGADVIDAASPLEGFGELQAVYSIQITPGLSVSSGLVLRPLSTIFPALKKAGVQQPNVLPSAYEFILNHPDIDVLYDQIDLHDGNAPRDFRIGVSNCQNECLSGFAQAQGTKILLPGYRYSKAGDDYYFSGKDGKVDLDKYALLPYSTHFS